MNEPTSGPSVLHALGRVVEAGQQLVADRIDVARIEVRDEVDRNVSGLVPVLFAAVLVLAAVLLGAGALALALAPAVPLPGSLGGMAAAAGAIGWALFRRGQRLLRRPSVAELPAASPPAGRALGEARGE